MANAKPAGRTTATTRRSKQDTNTKQNITIKHDMTIKQDMVIKQDMALQRWNKTSPQANSRETDLWRP